MHDFKPFAYYQDYFYSMSNSITECPFPYTPGTGATIISFSFFGQSYGRKLNLDLTTKESEYIPIFKGNLHFLVNLQLMFLAHFSLGVICFFLINSYARDSCILRILTHFSAIHVKFVI